jgi:glycosyltransferase involved in cell wall biosynthesis
MARGSALSAIPASTSGRAPSVHQGFRPASQPRRQLRVLFLVDNARTVGGAERFVTGLASHMPRDQIESWVCSTRQGDPRALRALEEAGVRHISLGRTGKWQIHRFLPLVWLVRREKFDVLHANMFGSNLWGALIGCACRVPVVIAHEHNWSYADDRRRMWIDRHVIGRLATAFVAVSAANRERMISLEGVPADKVVVMPLGHVPHADPGGGDIRSELGLGAKTPLVAVAAVMRPEKALDVLIEAHAILLERVPDAHLVIAGAGRCRPELEEGIKRLGIGDSVHLLGVRHDVDAILRCADVGAISSDFEGRPLFVFECMAAGTPLVATAVGGVPEVIQNGETGLLVPPRDPAALARALGRVLNDPALADRLATAAAARRSEFTIDSVGEQFAALYAQLVAGVGGSRHVG